MDVPLKISLRAVGGLLRDQAQKGVCKGPLTARELGEGWGAGVLREPGEKSLQWAQHQNA